MALISDDYIRRLSLGAKTEIVIRDSKLTGFAMRVRRRADGSLSRSFFVLQELPPFGNSRRRRKLTIGDYPTFTAEAARTEAESMLRAIQRGDDPAAARAEKIAQPLFKALAEDFELQHLAELKRGTQADYKGRIRRHLVPEFGDKRVVDISPQMIRDFHRRRGRKHPTDANRLLAVLSAMMSHAVALGWRPANPCMGIPRYTERARDAWLDEHDLPKFLKALAKVDGPYGELIRFLAVSGWRVSEARSLRWEMVDLKRMVANLPDSKTGEVVRALSTDAATLIDRQPRRFGYVFSKRGHHALDYRTCLQVLAGVCEAAEIAKITPHVLRHSAATWAAIAGAQAHELREAFGWKTLAMTARYVSRSESLARKGVQRAADAMNVLQRPVADVTDHVDFMARGKS